MGVGDVRDTAIQPPTLIEAHVAVRIGVEEIPTYVGGAEFPFHVAEQPCADAGPLQ